tara:strand:+ start:324 stop:635 length:312 start_codon:yes stop_codon:yes gene_type:complete
MKKSEIDSNTEIINKINQEHYINEYMHGIQSMRKTRNSNSNKIKYARTIIMDHDNNYYCFPVKLEKNDLKKFIFEIAENNYTIFSDLEIVQSSNGIYHYNYID